MDTSQIQPFAHAARSWKFMLFLISVLACTNAVVSDVVKMSDGREFEGKILEQTERLIRIDAVVATIRVTLKLPIDEVASVERAPLPDDFFKRFDTPKVRQEAPAVPGKEHGSKYLEVPISGTIGKDVLPEGLDKALNYADTHGIKHIVFTIDSKGGDMDTCQAIFDVLARYHKRLSYHVVIRHALGHAVGFTVWSRSIHITSTATWGGMATHVTSSSEDQPSEGEQVMSEHLVARNAAAAAERGIPPLVMRAMMLPEETLIAWKDKQDKILIGSTAPQDLSPEAIVLRDSDKTSLVLTSKQAVTLGLARTFEGTVAQLGKELGRDDWHSAGNMGATAMKVAAENRRAKLRVKDAKKRQFEEAVTQVVERQQYTEQYISRAWKEFERLDPRKGKYSTIDIYVGSSSGGYRYYTDTRVSAFTNDARHEWRNRTDQAIAAVLSLNRGVRTLRQLDEKAEKLGIEQSGKDRQGIDILHKRAATAFERLRRERNKSSP